MGHYLAFSDYWWDWGNLLFRWLHVIAATTCSQRKSRSPQPHQ